VKIKRMEIEVRKRETAGYGMTVYNETDTVNKFEVRFRVLTMSESGIVLTERRIPDYGWITCPW